MEINLKPYKKLGKGSEGIVIMTNNNKYTVKIYRLEPKYMISLIRIINYLQKYNILTIYKSYKFLSKKNSLKRYINELPEYFSYMKNIDLIKLSKNYNMKNRLIEIMKTYEITLNDFINNLLKNNSNNKDNKDKILIIESLYYQAIITLFWLYIKKGIIHKDLSLDNFFVEKTSNTNFELKIGKNIYNVKLYGYYLVMSDFCYAKSLELFDSDEYPNSLNSSFGSSDMNPYYELLTVINIFKKYIYINTDNYILNSGVFNAENNMSITTEYKNLLKSYIKNENFKEELKKFKKSYSIFVDIEILNNKSIRL